VASVDPAVEAPGEGIGHAVGVAVAEDAVDNLARIGAAVAVGVAKQEDVGNAMDQGGGRPGQGDQADRDVQAVGERLDRAGFSIGAEVREDLHRVAWSGSLLGGIGILDGIRDPEPPVVVEGEVERLLDVRLGGHELNLETRRHMKRPALLIGRAVRE